MVKMAQTFFEGNGSDVVRMAPRSPSPEMHIKCLKMQQTLSACEPCSVPPSNISMNINSRFNISMKMSIGRNIHFMFGMSLGINMNM